MSESLKEGQTFICQYLCQYAHRAIYRRLLFLIYYIMKEFKTYFRDEEIIRQVCKIRVKLAKSRNKKHLLHLLTSNPKYNYHNNSSIINNEFQEYQDNITQELKCILPPRKKWIKLGSYSRVKNTKSKSKEFLTSNDKNYYSLIKTIRKHHKQNSKEKWFLNLMDFIKQTRENALSYNYQVNTPIIFPKLKDPKKLPPLPSCETNDCRPICMFNLQDRVILSLTNKFLTRAFDNLFKDSSYAFRSRKIENKTVSHHNCIQEIITYKKNLKDDFLYVVECDMKKFYDTVNHKIALNQFESLIKASKENNPNIDFSYPIHIFNSYLNSYCFNINVIGISTPEYWKSYNIDKGQFPWVEEDIKNTYQNLKDERIGVPQGGALSGLIANIYLNEADEKLENFEGLYLRFCDDMIIIHNNLEEIQKAKDTYLKTLEELKLFTHPFNDNKLQKEHGKGISYKPFWKSKSKGPYKWSDEINKGHFPWIAFVGYHINFKGKLRVRKKSFEKEYQKQKQIIDEIKKAIEKEHRCKKGTPIESAINRLIGMSVGRIALHNFDEVSTDMCWKNGFKELKINKHSSRQLKDLDRNRSKLYYDLIKQVNELFENEESDPLNNSKKREMINYDKPFSYYYQVLERSKKS